MENLTRAQLDFLKNHQSIERVTSKHVIFSFEFKLMAVKSYLKGIPFKEIFKQERLDFLPSKYMNNAILRWRDKYNEQGEAGLKEKKKGRKNLHLEDNTSLSYEELLAKIELLELENDFLKKLRALKKK